MCRDLTASHGQPALSGKKYVTHRFTPTGKLLIHRAAQNNSSTGPAQSLPTKTRQRCHGIWQGRSCKASNMDTMVWQSACLIGIGTDCSTKAGWLHHAAGISISKYMAG